MRRVYSPLIAAALLAVACTDTAGPRYDGGRLKAAAAAPGSGIVLDQSNGTLNEQNVSIIAKGFNPTNPHVGDAIVATFIFSGSSNLITSVSDFVTDANHTPVGNTFHLVEFVTAGGIAMATYAATNVQGFPDPNPDPTVVYAVQATLSQTVSDAGIQISAYSGVAPVFTDALGGHSSGSGASSSATVSDAGSIPINAGALAYAYTTANALVGRDPPPGYSRFPGGTMSDNMFVAEGDFMVASAAGTTDPQWTWGGFSQPGTWLASVLALNPGSGTANQPPTAAFTSSCSALNCNFTSTSSDPDGTIASYAWTFGDGGTSNVQNPTHAYAAAGTYTVNLTVTDNAGATNSVSHSVTVSAANQSPTAAFTSSCNALSCAFTNSSSDPDGTIASNSWTFGDGGSSTAQNPSHSYAAAGTYTVTLTVTDNQGATNSVSHSVTVSAANQSPTAAFTSSCNSLSCAFTNSSSDPDGTIASNSWTFGDGATSTAPNPSHTYAAGGTYTVTLTVTDNQGATNSVSHTVTVTAPNQPPVAAFTSSCSSLSCNFTSSSSDPDGSISAYSWSFGDGGSSTAQNPSYTYSAGGTYTVTLTVTDNQGATNSVSHTVTVTAPNQPPVAAFSSSCSSLSCTFTSTSSDPDGSISAYSWTFGDGGSSTAQNPSHSYPVGGSYTVTLRVTDNQGATSSVSHTVTVTAPNSAPVVNAGPDETILLGVLYTLNASFSDPDNGPWTYTINWGDGTSSHGSKSSPGTISAGHTYLGLLTTRTITVTVTDSMGASGSDKKVITLIL